MNKNIRDEVENLTYGIEKNEVAPNDILGDLTKSIGQIDFCLLAFPDIEEIKKEMESLKPFVFDEDGSYNKENTKEVEGYSILQKKLNGYKLKKPHYLILCIEQLLLRSRSGSR